MRWGIVVGLVGLTSITRAKPQLLFKKTNAKAFAPLKEGSGPLFAHVPNKDAQTDEAVDA